MPSAKSAKSLRDTFALGAAQEISLREHKARKAAAAADKAAAQKAAAEKQAAAEAKRNAAFEKKIVKTFAEAKKLYDAVFGDKKRFDVTLTDNSITIQLQEKSGNYKDAPYMRSAYFGKKIAVANGRLSQTRWGNAIDPQMRNYPVSLHEKDLFTALQSPARLFGDETALHKMKSLTAPAPKQKPKSAPKPPR